MDNVEFQVDQFYYQVEFVRLKGRTSPVISTWAYDGLSPHDAVGSASDEGLSPFSFSLVTWTFREDPSRNGFDRCANTKRFPALESPQCPVHPWGAFMRLLPTFDEELARARALQDGLPVEGDEAVFEQRIERMVRQAAGDPRHDHGGLHRGELFYWFGAAWEFGSQPVIETAIYDGYLKSRCCTSSVADKPYHWYYFTLLKLCNGHWAVPDVRDRRRCPNLRTAEHCYLSWEAVVSRRSGLFRAWPEGWTPSAGPVNGVE